MIFDVFDCQRQTFSWLVASVLIWWRLFQWKWLRLCSPNPADKSTLTSIYIYIYNWLGLATHCSISLPGFSLFNLANKLIIRIRLCELMWAWEVKGLCVAMWEWLRTSIHFGLWIKKCVLLLFTQIWRRVHAKVKSYTLFQEEWLVTCEVTSLPVTEYNTWLVTLPRFIQFTCIQTLTFNCFEGCFGASEHSLVIKKKKRSLIFHVINSFSFVSYIV